MIHTEKTLNIDSCIIHISAALKQLKLNQRETFHFFWSLKCFWSITKAFERALNVSSTASISFYSLTFVQFGSSTKIPVSNEQPFLRLMVSISIMTASDKMIRYVSQHPPTCLPDCLFLVDFFFFLVIYNGRPEQSSASLKMIFGCPADVLISMRDYRSRLEIRDLPWPHHERQHVQQLAHLLEFISGPSSRQEFLGLGVVPAHQCGHANYPCSPLTLSDRGTAFD